MDVNLYQIKAIDFITTGANNAVANADATPTIEFFPVGSDSPLVLSEGRIYVNQHTNKTGHYWLSFMATENDGFSAGYSYSVVVSYSIASVNFKRIIETVFVSFSSGENVLDKLTTMIRGSGGEDPYTFTSEALFYTPSSSVDPAAIWEYEERTLTSGGDDPWATGLHGQYQVGSAGHMIEQIDSRVDYLYDRVYQVPGTGPVAVIPAPSHETQTVAYAYCYDANGTALEGVIITIQVIATTTTGGGAAYSGITVTAVSNALGVASVEIPRGTHITFRAKRGNGRWMQFTGVDADTVQIPYIVGHPDEVIVS